MKNSDVCGNKSKYTLFVIYKLEEPLCKPVCMFQKKVETKLPFKLAVLLFCTQANTQKTLYSTTVISAYLCSFLFYSQ